MKKTTFLMIALLYVTQLVVAQRPILENPKSWSMIVLPDIQNYSKWERNQPILDLMTAWIAENIDSLNIQMVLCVGDLVEQNDLINQGHDGNQTGKQQWEMVSRSFGRLDNKVPYILATGNHDYNVDKQGIRHSRYNEYITIEKNWLNRKAIVQNATNEHGEPTLENSAFEIKRLHGQDYLFLNIEFAPRDTIVTWAQRVASLPQYKNHRVILLTHAYLNNKDQRTSKHPKWFTYEPYAIDRVVQKSPMIPLPDANHGEQIWEKLVNPSGNIEMVISGHISGEGYRMDRNKQGKAVHQMLFDTQSEGGGHRNGNGGDGWIRILEFFPDNKTVKVKTFSPLFGASPKTESLAWKNDERNEFTLSFD
ncbi:metallophosphoesterase [Sphingobacterium gobiense]|uniref:Serine/threonine protein phosphatase n=1 Tax=Sphingobacterium gobiense TaxID=1382456 RepID=A0A2S9JSI4_9SPHI|nr:metallophosphoesterase [Sphingobacterium gobiense]PRD56101.1 serine/threonine protein phosphatase [Sphingobacterium gobiense]